MIRRKRCYISLGVVLEAVDLDAAVDRVAVHVVGGQLVAGSNVGEHVGRPVSERAHASELRPKLRVRVLGHRARSEQTTDARNTANHTDFAADDTTVWVRKVSCCTAMATTRARFKGGGANWAVAQGLHAQLRGLHKKILPM